MCSPQALYAFPIARVFHDKNEIEIERVNPSQVPKMHGNAGSECRNDLVTRKEKGPDGGK
jgi:hypothetical protein